MQDGIRTRFKQIAAWAVFGLFLAGFLVSRVGAFTGPVLGVWFVGTQKPGRGFLWMLAMALVPSALWHWRGVAAAGSGHRVEALGWLAVGALLSVLPLLFHRLVSAHLPRFWSTIPFPLAAYAIHWTTAAVLLRANLAPASRGVASTEFMPLPAREFLLFWLAAIVVWLWNRDLPGSRAGARANVALYCAAGAGATMLMTGFPRDLSFGAAGGTGLLPALCGAVCLLLALWAMMRAHSTKDGTAQDDLELLRSPVTGEGLAIEVRDGREVLVSASGTQFPVRDGIPDFVRGEDLSGANGKYNRLYETIGGFYDDSQRVVCALTGMDRDAYVMSYLGRLEVKAGDKVLETSVGTGLNFKYLPAGIERYGLDLSPAMLERCRANLSRWGLPGALFLGNAEALPFADASFDVVFHVGGINFFNDRALAMREMIRVAKPGSLLLIADETEEHVQRAYENFPITGEYFKDRTDKVAAPVDLVPAEMEEVRLEILSRNRFYALTFRKPRNEQGEPAEATGAACEGTR